MKKQMASKILLLLIVACPPIVRADVESTGDTIMKVMVVAPFAHSAYHDDTEGMLQYGEGAITTQALTTLGKEAINKERPNGNCCNSFPSGHASAAFHSAFYIAERYSYTEAIPYFAGATYVAYSRVESDKHDWEDVAAGAGLSFVVNHYFTSNEASGNKPKIGIYARDDGGMEVLFDWRW